MKSSRFGGQGSDQRYLRSAMLYGHVVVALLCSAAIASGQTCDPYWTGLNAPVGPINSTRDSMAVFDDGTGLKLYITGYLPQALGPPERGVMRWDGREWEPVNDGYLPSRQPYELMVLDDGGGKRLYVSGLQSGSGWWMRVWNGQQQRWTPVPPNFPTIHDGWPLLSFDDGTGPAIYGVTVHPHTQSNNNVSRWNGTSWEVIGAPDMPVTRMIIYDDGSGPMLHVAGFFTTINGVPASRAAKWTGSTWEALGAGIASSTIYHAIVHDDGNGSALYLCNVRNAGGMQVNHIARWDGQNWSDVGGGIPVAGITTVRVLASFDDGTGPALFAGGYMNMAGGGVPVRSIARFKDGAWDDMGGGVSGGIPHAMTVFDDGRGPSLFVAGSFLTVGSGADWGAARVAQWVGCDNQCYANCDNSSISSRLNVDDFTCFINKFAYGDPYVDCNQDGVRDIDDFVCFITRFAEGCEL